MTMTRTALATLVAVALAACSGTGATTNTSNSTSSSAQGDTTITNASAATALVDAGASSVADAQSANAETHESADDYVTPNLAGTTTITLNGDTIAVDGVGAIVSGTTATIQSAGTYTLSGTLTDGQIVVDTQQEGTVRLILNGVSLSSSTTAPIYVANADKVVIELATGTTNTVSDASTYVYASADVDEPNAAIFSADDLTIYGEGALVVNGNANDGIASKDGLIIAGGTITVTAADDGIRGKDYLVVEGGTLTVAAQGDGLTSTNDTDASKGYISIRGGALTVVSGGDALSAESDILVSDGTLNLTAGGGSGAQVADGASAKGIKATVNVVIDGGALTIDSADDALHSNGTIVVNGGTVTLASGDDGVHADSVIDINGGELTIATSYEGIESASITLDAGTVRVTSSDDALNASAGATGDIFGGGMGGGGMQNDGSRLTINGGLLVVNAYGDGLDSNGSIAMTGGTVLVSGPTEQMNGAIDYNGGFVISGGLLVAAGSSGMAEAPATDSTQSSVLIYFSATQPGGTTVNIQDSTGQNVLTFTPAKDFQSIVVSSSALTSGASYTVYTGGAATGTIVDGLVTDGSYSGGTQAATFSVSSSVTQVGSGGGFGPGGGGGPRRP